MANQDNNKADFTYKYFFFYYYLYFFQYNLFLLDYNGIHKKQKFGALDIVESQSKEMWFSSYVVSVEIITQVSLTPWSIFLFLDICWPWNLGLWSLFCWLTNPKLSWLSVQQKNKLPSPENYSNNRPSQIACTVTTVYVTCTQTTLHVHVIDWEHNWELLIACPHRPLCFKKIRATTITAFLITTQ